MRALHIDPDSSLARVCRQDPRALKRPGLRPVIVSPFRGGLLTKALCSEMPVPIPGVRSGSFAAFAKQLDNLGVALVLPVPLGLECNMAAVFELEVDAEGQLGFGDRCGHVDIGRPKQRGTVGLPIKDDFVSAR